MADQGLSSANKKTKKIEKEINEIYGQAQKEIEQKISNWGERFSIKNDIYKQKLADGTITEDQYNAWFAGQMFQSEQWHAKEYQIVRILDNANQQAANIVNGSQISVFTDNYNWIHYDLERTAGVNFGFNVYDQHTVTELIKGKNNILPKWKIDKPKDYIWNAKKVRNCVTQGIIQGEGVNQIANRIATVTCNQNKNLALTHARTAMTGAQNSGRNVGLQDAKKLGIKTVKEWMATLDGHTRDSHRSLDGEQIDPGDPRHPTKFSNGCRFPGDPQGPAHEVFNCRCTLVGDIIEYPEEYKRYDNIDGIPINNMTYKDWEKKKTLENRPVYKTEQKRHELSAEVLGRAHTAEAYVTQDLLDAVGLGTGHLEGLDYRFKGKGSLERKIRDKSLKKNITEEQYAPQITDALRYTNLSTTENLTSDFWTVRNSLEQNGYKMVEIANTIGDPTAPYRGINTLVQTPDGYIFELQFHTPESLEIKEINHKLYETARLSTTTEQERNRLNLEMSDNAASIPTPPGASSIENVVMK